MVDKVKPLKIEDSTSGTEINFGPTEADPSEDHLAAKGIALENSDSTILYGDSGVMKFKDSEITSAATLKDAIERLKQKDVDVSDLTTGHVLTWDNVDNRFELQSPGALTSGITPPVIFTKVGNTSAGTYLRTGEVITSRTGVPTRGTNKIVAIHVSTSSLCSGSCVFQIQRRTGVSTFTDITNATVTIINGEYKAKNDPIDITLGADEEISCYYKSGSRTADPVVHVFLVPV